jgi:membrane protease YdiL (CAAX protease family)
VKPRDFRIPVIGAAVLILILEIVSRSVPTDAVWVPMLETILTRLVGAVVFVPLIRRMGYRTLGRAQRHPDPLGTGVLAAAWIVALNNLPAVGFLTGNARVTAGGGVIALFAVECAAVGCFEELAFRGFLLPFCLERMRGRSRAVFRAALVSSLIFGAVHLVNLLSGASFGAVLMQIGYSFLIGGMCAAVLVASGSVWMCAAVHAVYNFCGTLLSRFGEGIRWDALTVALTVVLGLAAAVFLLWFLWNAEDRGSLTGKTE